MAMDPVDLKSLERLWPNRTHESNWFKALLCALGLHRRYRLEASGAVYSFCRWCPKIALLELPANNDREYKFPR